MLPETVVALADPQDGVPFIGRVAGSDLDRRSATGKEWRAGYRALKRPATLERSRRDLEGNCVPGGRRVVAGVETPGNLRTVALRPGGELRSRWGKGGGGR
jgi:hypothetical protein